MKEIHITVKDHLRSDAEWLLGDVDSALNKAGIGIRSDDIKVLMDYEYDVDDI